MVSHDIDWVRTLFLSYLDPVGTSCHIIRCLSFHESRTIPYYSILFHICPYSSPVRRMILICPIKISLFLLENHWIGLRENLQETMVFTCFYHQIDRAFRWNMFPSSNSMFLMFLMFLSFWISAKHLNYASVLDGVILRRQSCGVFELSDVTMRAMAASIDESSSIGSTVDVNGIPKWWPFYWPFYWKWWVSYGKLW